MPASRPTATVCFDTSAPDARLEQGRYDGLAVPHESGLRAWDSEKMRFIFIGIKWGRKVNLVMKGWGPDGKLVLQSALRLDLDNALGDSKFYELGFTMHIKLFGNMALMSNRSLGADA